jgi:hypothetical protein
VGEGERRVVKRRKVEVKSSERLVLAEHERGRGPRDESGKCRSRCI